MAFEGHAGLENGRSASGESEFQLGVNDPSLDESRPRFAHEEVEQIDGHSNDPTRQAIDAGPLLHLFELNVVREIVIQIYYCW